MTEDFLSSYIGAAIGKRFRRARTLYLVVFYASASFPFYLHTLHHRWAQRYIPGVHRSLLFALSVQQLLATHRVGNIWGLYVVFRGFLPGLYGTGYYSNTQHVGLV
jgi:hypothetical protein